MALLNRTKATDEENARAEVERLMLQERTWHDRRRRVANQLADLERTAGAALVDADDADSALREQAAGLASLRAEVAACDHAIEEARRQREARIPNVLRAQAAVKRKRAAELRKEAESRQRKTDGLLAELRAHEGVDYDVKQASRPMSPLALTADGRLEAIPLNGAPVIVRIAVARTQMILGEAAQLEQEAEEMEGRRVSRSGYADGENEEDLLDNATANPMIIAPTIASIEAWAEERIAAERGRRAQYQPGMAHYVDPATPIRLNLHWRDAVIDERSSSVAGA